MPETETYQRNLRAAAKRAKAEAEIRRKQAPKTKPPAETKGRAGLEPTRYGDWEKKGLTIDF